MCRSLNYNRFSAAFFMSYAISRLEVLPGAGLTDSGLSLGCIQYWKISSNSNIVDELKNQGETVDDDTLAHNSLLPYKHVLPKGTYFINKKETQSL